METREKLNFILERLSTEQYLQFVLGLYGEDALSDMVNDHLDGLEVLELNDALDNAVACLANK